MKIAALKRNRIQLILVAILFLLVLIAFLLDPISLLKQAFIFTN